MTSGERTIGALAKAAGVKIETIRYYERIGLVPVASRRASRYRVYGPDDVKRLVFVRRARALGFTLEEISALISLGERGEGACAEVQQVAAAHLESVRAKINDLRLIERTLTTAVQQCRSGGRVACPVIEVLSQ